MGFSTGSLYGYFVKCGVPENDAQLISSIFGDSYTELHIMYRGMGEGVQSKALAALRICDNLFNCSWYAAHPLWESVNCISDVYKVISIVRSAGICIVAVSAYALHQSKSEDVSKYFLSFLSYSNEKACEFGEGIDYINYHKEFKEELEKIETVSSAFGQRKGIFSRIFG